MSEDLKKKVLNVISEHRTGVLSTVENNKPHSRYMTFYHDQLTLYTPTKRETEKVEELEKNPAVSVLLGYEKHGQSDAYIEISGTAAINDSQELKGQYWDDSFQNWFSGPEDPNYILIEIQPEVVRLLNMEGKPSQELTL
jgi:general stress protein 26